MIDHAAFIDVAADVPANSLPIEQFMVVHAMAPPQRLLGLEGPHVRLRVGGVDVAALQIAVDAVPGHPVIDDPGALLHEPPDEPGGLLPVAAADRLDAGVQPVDDLPAIAAGRAPADGRPFDHDDLETLLRQVQRGREAGIACADDADVGFHLAGELHWATNDVA